MRFLALIPGYLWTLMSLVCGLVIGGFFGSSLGSVARGTQYALEGFITIVPVLIFVALSPAVSKLANQGSGGRLAAMVIFWYLLTSVAAGLLGLVTSTLLFDIKLSAPGENLIDSAVAMFKTLNGESGASGPLLAILIAVLIGLLAVKLPPLQRLLVTCDQAMAKSTPLLSRIMPFLVFFLGITLGVNTGAADSIKYYLLMTGYTLFLCVIWLALYLLVVIKLMAGQSIKKVLKVYYFPTAVFAAGTCSSLATLPVNLANIKKYGVDESVSNFVIPIGSVINMDASALAYVAYAPFILTIIFDVPVTWSALLVAWPAIVLFTIAAPGLPAGMGTALWSSTLFAALLGLSGEDKTQFITTWIALSGGLPDMFRTATNCTGDGMTAILFSQRMQKQAAVTETVAVTGPSQFKGRKQFGRIAIANWDAAASAMTESAIEQRYRATQEILGES